MRNGLRLTVIFMLSALIGIGMFSEEIKAAAVDITVSPETGRLQPNEELDVTVEVSVPGGDLTVVESVYYRWDGVFGGDITTHVKNNAGTADINGLRSSEPGTKQLDIVVETSDDDVLTTKTFDYIIDDTAPVVTLETAADPGAPKKSRLVTVNLDGNDEEDRYFVAYYWSDVELDVIANPGVIEDWIDDGEHNLLLDNPSYDSPVDALDGAWYFYVKVTDEAGNETIDQSGPLLIDNTPPVLNLINGMPPACSLEEYPEIGTAVPCEDSSEYPMPIYPLYVDVMVDGKTREELAGYTFRYHVDEEPQFYWSGDVSDSWGEITDNGRFQLSGFAYDSTAPNTRYVQLSIEDPAGNISYHLSHQFTVDEAYAPAFIVYPEAILHLSEPFLDVEVFYKKGDAVIDSIEFMYALSSEEHDATEDEFIVQEVTGMTLVEDHEYFTGYYTANVTLDFSGWELQEGIEYDVDVYQIDSDSGFRNNPMGPFFYYDVTAPVITEITYDPVYDPESPYSGTVTATVHYSDDLKLPSGGKTATAEYVFTANGTRSITLEDAAGNTVSAMLKVDWIDADYNVTYSTAPGVWTNQSVTATITFKGDALVTFDDMDEPVSEREYVITENGSYTLGYVDAGDVAGEVELFVDWIDMTPPRGALFYKIDESVKGVTATLSASDNSGVEPILTDADGNEIDGDWTNTFTSNGTYIFYFKDAAGNVSSVTAEVSNFDVTPPELSIQYSTTDVTNTNVRATVKANERISVINNDGLNYYDFGENGTFTFQVEDRFGNASEITAVVNNIDKLPPVPVITYSTTETTKDNVVATIAAEAGESFTVLNNFGRKSYVFTENGSFTFIIADPAGNRVEATATVGNIDKSKVSYTLTYSEEELTANDVTVTVVPEAGKTLEFPENSGSPSVTFEENGMTWLLAVDELGNEYWIQLMVQWMDKEAPTIEIDRKYIVPQGGIVPDLMAGVTVEDNFGDYTVVHAEDIDTSVIGTYEVTYTATDSVGNTSTAVRVVEIVDTSQLTIYVNGQLAEEGMNIHSDVLHVDVVGTLGQWELHGASGNHKVSRFKSGGYLLDRDQPIAMSTQDYYTLLVRDQELQQQLIHLYVIPQDGRGE